MKHDVIVVGGSYSGMAAALQLLRARRSVLIIDGGKRRNRRASHSHGFLGQDGADPAQLARVARAQLATYPTLTWLDGEVDQAAGTKDDFRVTCGGTAYLAKRLLLAIGVLDRLPEIPGLSERWGKSVFHCPYCHGYELDRGRIGVIATGPKSIHQAQLLPEWGDTTFFLNGAFELNEAAAEELARRGVSVEVDRIALIEESADVVLNDGRRMSFAGLFTAPRNEPSTTVAEQLDCRLIDTGMGVQIWTGETKETTAPGVFACGDAARVPHSVSLAVGDGAWAGAQLHRSLVWPES
ncbi:NAD(P)/FAD-dependent oxidoreductase [Rhodanobacter denitrificans]|uniref:NAD(P)/FAD-dependent oxidoreductase n=1 Tax=Rhodanobacter denitrificans TaxID=666685 RepID=UPI001F1A44F5|nr:NAD(P)/FAD-dependent oxidoreductase [Rhodanobacter denitrificans]UJJ60226.1 NAD(P)/FAD-dependent oxidoreductase [Rhodanobacter denitrificans]